MSKLLTCISLVVISSLSTAGQRIEIKECPKVSGPSYKIGDKSKLVSDREKISLQISLNKKYFNREDMVKLVKKLRADYCNFELVSVVLYDNHKNSRDPGNTYVMFRSNYKIIRMRGFYNLDRATGEEGLDFSLAPGNLTTEVQLRFKDGELLP